MKKAELVFIPLPVMGHIVSTVELAKLLIGRDNRLSITVLIMKLPFDSMATAYTESLTATSATGRIRFINLPDDNSHWELIIDSKAAFNFINLFFENQKPHVKEAVTQLTRYESGPESPQLAGFVIDMLCTCMIDVANEFGSPTYVFFPSNAAFLGTMFHLQTLQDESNMDLTKFKDSGTELVIPSFVNPVPAKLLPSSMLDKDGGSTAALRHARRYRETKGIIVNTFMELESLAVQSLADGTTPKIYPVGPILNLRGEPNQQTDIMTWLDKQPPSSVVFLCFGSMGSFGAEQVKEIAHGLELSGQRFLWSLRRRPPNGKFASPTNYTNPVEVLPEGFSDRTDAIGKVIGWAPQAAVLGHPAVGGFVSHCGWNSILESLWFGVPIASWPLYSEQRLNGFRMVKELGLAVEIKMDYRKSDPPIFVTAEELEGGIRCVMEYDSEVRKKVRMMKEKSRKGLMEGGSSYTWLGHLIEDVMYNMP